MSCSPLWLVCPQRRDWPRPRSRRPRSFPTTGTPFLLPSPRRRRRRCRVPRRPRPRWPSPRMRRPWWAGSSTSPAPDRFRSARERQGPRASPVLRCRPAPVSPVPPPPLSTVSRARSTRRLQRGDRRPARVGGGGAVGGWLWPPWSTSWQWWGRARPGGTSSPERRSTTGGRRRCPPATVSGRSCATQRPPSPSRPQTEPRSPSNAMARSTSWISRRARRRRCGAVSASRSAPGSVARCSAPRPVTSPR